jgi:hypothetical protein
MTITATVSVAVVVSPDPAVAVHYVRRAFSHCGEMFRDRKREGERDRLVSMNRSAAAAADRFRDG